MKSIDLISKHISEKLINRKEKVAVAESVTAGALQNSFSNMPNASEFFEGGLTTYTPLSKINLLNIDAIEAERENCVSQNIAEQMAKNLIQYFDADWFMGVTGYASPVPESNNKLFAFYSISYHQKILISQKVALDKELTPTEAQRVYVELMLSNFDRILLDIHNYI